LDDLPVSASSGTSDYSRYKTAPANHAALTPGT